MEGAIKSRVKSKVDYGIKSEKSIEVKLNDRHRKVLIKTVDIKGERIVPNIVVCIYKRAKKYICVIEDIEGYRFVDYAINIGILSNVVEIELKYKKL